MSTETETLLAEVAKYYQHPTRDAARQIIPKLVAALMVAEGLEPITEEHL